MEILKITKYKNILLLSKDEEILSHSINQLIEVLYADGGINYIDVEGLGDITNFKLEPQIKENSEKEIIFEQNREVYGEQFDNAMKNAHRNNEESTPISILI